MAWWPLTCGFLSWTPICGSHQWVPNGPHPQLHHGCPPMSPCSWLPTTGGSPPMGSHSCVPAPPCPVGQGGRPPRAVLRQVRVPQRLRGGGEHGPRGAAAVGQAGVGAAVPARAGADPAGCRR